MSQLSIFELIALNIHIERVNYVEQKMSDILRGLREVAKRNVRNAIWRFEDLRIPHVVSTDIKSVEEGLADNLR